MAEEFSALFGAGGTWEKVRGVEQTITAANMRRESRKSVRRERKKVAGNSREDINAG
jgi:hypothetical protein